MDFANPHFAEPGWLWLAGLAPVALALLLHYAARARQRQLARVASPQFLGALTASHSPARRRCKHALLLLAVACLGLALARPQWGELELSDEWLGEDVVFALDCSNSMLAADVRPNRLERAKLAIMDFVRQGGAGRVGLVAFAGGAFLQCPLTFDHEAFEDALMAMDEKTIPTPGTDIGRALLEADHAMERKSRRKLVVLVTDGEDLERGGVQTAEALKTNGVVVFTVGVGSPAGTEIQVRNRAGQLELLRDARGEVVRSRLDEPTLRAIAEATGGKYFPLGPRGDGLERVRSSFGTLQSPLSGRQARRPGVERFHVPLALALLLLAAERLLGTRRRENAPVMASTPARAVTAGLLGLMVLSPWPHARAAAKEGTNLLAQAIPPTPAPPPVTPREKYNAGTRLLLAGKLNDAEGLFQSVLQSQDERTRDAALYNLGHVRFAQGAEELKKGPSGEQTMDRGRASLERGQAALDLTKSALSEGEVNRMVAAYLAGRGARREFRGALKAVRAALETYAATLLKWRRALGDFRSAAELNPANSGAAQNAKVVERAIAKLVDEVHEMMQMAMMMSQMSQELKEQMQALKGRIPMENMPPGAPGDEEDEDEMMPESLRGQKEDAGKEGRERERPLSPEEAGRMLDGFQRDGGKRLPMSDREVGGDKPGKPDQHPLRPW